MSVSSLSLRSVNMAKLAVLSFLASGAAAVIVKTPYQLTNTYTGSTFFDNFDFFTGADPNGGYVTYEDFKTATDDGLISSDDSYSYMGTDTMNVYNPKGAGRSATKLLSKATFNHGLFITKITNMPGGVCGTVPGYYVGGGQGEFSTISGMNNDDFNTLSLFTAGPFDVVGNNGKGDQKSTTCATGCSTTDSEDSAYGLDFNDNDGGIFATQWESDGVNIWFWADGDESAPSDLETDTPDPSGWGIPVASFTGSSSVDGVLSNGKIVFDTNFCGTLVESLWSASSCGSLAATCAEYVATNFADFAQQYWAVSYVKIFQSTGVTPPPAPSSTTSSVPHSTSIPSVKGYSYYGCFRDTNARQFYDDHFVADPMTIERCADYCSAYSAFGLEYTDECYCANAFKTPPELLDDSVCDTQCTGDASQTCGGSLALSVFTNSHFVEGAPAPVSSSNAAPVPTSSTFVAPSVIAGPTPSPVEAPSSSTEGSSSVLASALPSSSPLPTVWDSVGCFASDDGFSTFWLVANDSPDNDVEFCTALCDADHEPNQYAALHDGDCYCGDRKMESATTPYPPDSCDIPCPGDDSEFCGGDVMTPRRQAKRWGGHVPSTVLFSIYAKRAAAVVSSSLTDIPASSTIVSDPSAAPSIIVDPNPVTAAPSSYDPGTSTTSFSTSTVYTTTVYTVTACPATVTDCPDRIGRLTTETVSLYTTVCPVTATPTPPTTTSYSTSTVYTTYVYTITACPATVTNCPDRIGMLTTEVVSLYTTICPVTTAPTLPPPISHGDLGTPTTTIVVATYTNICPTGLITTATSFTTTIWSGAPPPTIPMTTTTATVTLTGSVQTITLTLPFTTTTLGAMSTGAMKGNVGSFAPTPTAVILTTTKIVIPVPVKTDTVASTGAVPCVSCAKSTNGALGTGGLPTSTRTPFVNAGMGRAQLSAFAGAAAVLVGVFAAL